MSEALETCAACGVDFEKHKGLVPTCADLIEVNQAYRELARHHAAVEGAALPVRRAAEAMMMVWSSLEVRRMTLETDGATFGEVVVEAAGWDAVADAMASLEAAVRGKERE